MERPEQHLDAVEFPPHFVEESELVDERPHAPVDRPPQRQVRIRSRKRLALILFVTTCVSTFVAGMVPGGGLFSVVPKLATTALADQLSSVLPGMLWDGFVFSGCLIGILFAHEMGHYLQARRYRVPATLPYFIPFPISPIGTMGAVIIQGAGVADRKVLFDIAITGPLAGLVLALPITYIGVTHATMQMIPPNYAGLLYGDPLILQWIIDFVHGPRPAGAELQLNAMLFAGWVGIFITALNLVPIGQLDGGHLLYTLIGRRAHVVAILVLAGAVLYMVYSHYIAYGLIVLLLILMGPRHPPTADDTVPLGRFRIFLGWLTMCFIIIGFTPTPIIEIAPQPRHERPRPMREDAQTERPFQVQAAIHGMPETPVR